MSNNRVIADFFATNDLLILLSINFEIIKRNIKSEVIYENLRKKLSFNKYNNTIKYYILS